MQDETQKTREIALWRFQVIAPLVALEGPRGAQRREIRRICSRTHDHPIRGRIHLGYGTVEGWLYMYRSGGIDGLLPRSRHDRGKSRRIDDEIAERIETLAKGRPDLDGPGIIGELRSQLDGRKVLPSLSTLYRFLRAQGLDQRRAPSRRDHRAYAFDLAGDCWQGDVMYGPAIPQKDGTRRKTYLIAIIDDATRLIAHAQFYFEQHLRSLKDCLKQALLKRGVARRFYFDNGKIFRSRLLLQIAARLGIHLIHSRPYRPQGRAKIERWFRTVRQSFLRRVDLARIQDLEHLNRLLFAWIEGEYHVSAHRALGGETPLDRWVRLSEGIRPVPQDIDLDVVFLEETTRRVAKDGTFALRGKVFEAGPTFIAERVTVYFDPFDLRRVMLRDRRGKTTEAFPVDLWGNRYVRRESEKQAPEVKPAPELKALEDLAQRMDQAPPINDAKEK
jgi:transposase InsO family protein